MGACRRFLSVYAAKGFGSPPQEQQAPSAKREQGNKSSKTRKTSEQVRALTLLVWTPNSDEICPEICGAG